MTKARPLLIANWKMTLSKQAALALAKTALESRSRWQINSELWLTPSFPAVESVAQLCQGAGILVGAQNVHFATQGAYTGEVSVPMLQEVGASFAIVGHSERRHGLGETHAVVAERAAGALAQKMTVVFCVGETGEERARGETTQVLLRQCEPLFAKAKCQAGVECLVAYEPVWAIGTGKSCDAGDIPAVVDTICGTFEGAGWPKPRILYGGSVNAANVSAYLAVPGICGVLVGGASSKAESLLELLMGMR